MSDHPSTYRADGNYRPEGALPGHARALVADANLIEIGWSVYAIPLSDDPDLPRRGGVVCGIERWDDVDAEGEIIPRALFRCRSTAPGSDPMNEVFLYGSEVDPSQSIPFNRNGATVLARRIAKACGRTRTNGIPYPFTRTEVGALADAYHLVTL